MMLSLRLESFNSHLFYPHGNIVQRTRTRAATGSRAPCGVLCVDAYMVPARRQLRSLPGREGMRWQPWEQPWGQDKVGDEHRYPFIDGQRSGLVEDEKRGRLTL